MVQPGEEGIEKKKGLERSCWVKYFLIISFWGLGWVWAAWGRERDKR